MRKKTGKIVFWLFLTVLCAVFLYSAYRLIDYYHQQHRLTLVTQQAERYVRKRETADLTDEGEEAPLVVDFDALKKLNSDVVAWLYCPDTHINYPVVQASDNDYYLYRQLDGTWNSNGTLFMDYRCQSNMGDGNTIIYGHHMKSGTMFGDLVYYKEQQFYDSHPYMYLATPENSYRLELLAGCVVKADAEIFQDTAITQSYLQHCMANSTFHAAGDSIPQGAFLTLSTCSFEFDDARYIVLGVLVPIA